MPRRREIGVADQLLGLVIVFLVSFVLLKRWWRARALKQAEIRKLMILAAQEAARVEAEAYKDYASYSHSYSYSAPPPFQTQQQHHQQQQQQQQQQQCAVCFSPTTTRCSRCKAVRYCSAKCQIVHWRQGHKYECKPPDINGPDAVSNSPIQRNQNKLPNGFSRPNVSKSSEFEEERVRNSVSSIKNGDEITSCTNIPTVFGPQNGGVNERPDHLEFANSNSYVFEGTSEAKHEILGSHITPPEELDSSVELPTGCSADASPSEGLVISNVPQTKKTTLDSLSDIKHKSATQHSGSSGANETAVEVPKVESSTIDSSEVHSPSLNGPISEPSVLDAQCNSVSDASSGSSIEDDENECLTSQESDILDSMYNSDMLKEGMDFSSRNGNVKVQKESESVNDPSNDQCDAEDSFASKAQSFEAVATHHDILSVTDGSAKIDTKSNATMRNSRNNFLSSESYLSTHTVQKPLTSKLANSRDQQAKKDAHLSSASCVSRELTAPENASTKIDSSVDSATICDSSGGRSKSCRTFGQHSSAQKEKATCPFSRRTGSFDAISSTALQSVVSSLPSGNTFKASVKKVAQQLKPSKVSKQIATKLSNEFPGKDVKMLFPYESFFKIFTWDKFDLAPCGLINCGNSCYANAVLQCLMFTRPIVGYLLQGSHSKKCQKKDWCFMCELQYLVAKVREGRGPVSPVRILTKIEYIGHHLDFGREEDAHEFLRYAIDTMQSVCISEAGGERMLEPAIQDTTLVQQTFGGYLLSRIKCLKCQHVSERYEKMMDLTVEIEGNIESLQDALGRFTAAELLDGPNKYKCDRCKSYVKAKKQLTIHEAPNILTIALKRFQYGKFGKLNKRVTFPEVLNMKPYMSGAGDKPPAYKLFAVVVHLDMMNASFSGHYVCYVKHFQGSWYKMDDSRVKPVDIDRVLAQGAYMLLYSRSTPRPPVLSRNWIGSSSKTVNVVSKVIRQPVLKNGQESFSTSDGRYPPSSSTVNGYNHGNVFLGSRIGARDYMDLTSSDSGSLFSFSDEASYSTESNRDSTSTDDFAEATSGDAGHMMYASPRSNEDPRASSRTHCCLRSNPAVQTAYYFDDGTFFTDSNSQEYHENRSNAISAATSSLDTSGLSDWFGDNASSFFFPSAVQNSHVGTDSLHSDPYSNRLDSRKNISSVHVEPSQFSTSSTMDPDVLYAGSTVSRSDFADTARSKYQNHSYASAFFGDSERFNFDASIRSANPTSSSSNYFVPDREPER